jgi:hypothetical protein
MRLDQGFLLRFRNPFLIALRQDCFRRDAVRADAERAGLRRHRLREQLNPRLAAVYGIGEWGCGLRPALDDIVMRQPRFICFIPGRTLTSTIQNSRLFRVESSMESDFEKAEVLAPSRRLREVRRVARRVPLVVRGIGSPSVIGLTRFGAPCSRAMRRACIIFMPILYERRRECPRTAPSRAAASVLTGVYGILMVKKRGRQVASGRLYSRGRRSLYGSAR